MSRLVSQQLISLRLKNVILSPKRAHSVIRLITVSGLLLVIIRLGLRCETRLLMIIWVTKGDSVSKRKRGRIKIFGRAKYMSGQRKRFRAMRKSKQQNVLRSLWKHT